ncbi:PREDICTED: uncharacterized protein LOC108618460 [Drosophila arizonae]|uniref:Uncharacterized protein LOC108618460 n=1 Tax=Drosophila arizonae TaxID=7263 RepID=A0ABM1PRY5_DROAR|nr:PREDICTED: uncharacterized protein LOC108618460 [Drosophila arizonae]
MGDANKASAEPSANKPKAKPKGKAVSSKPKKGSVLSAIEDIQRMSPEAICQEFDRLVDHTQRHFNREAHMPCTAFASQVQRCLEQHRRESYKCFVAMEDYRQCVSAATQEHIDQLAQQKQEQDAARHKHRPQEHKQEQPPLHALPVVPPQIVGVEALKTGSKEPRRRHWYKPWSWLR